MRQVPLRWLWWWSRCGSSRASRAAALGPRWLLGRRWYQIPRHSGGCSAQPSRSIVADTAADTDTTGASTDPTLMVGQREPPAVAQSRSALRHDPALACRDESVRPHRPVPARADGHDDDGQAGPVRSGAARLRLSMGSHSWRRIGIKAVLNTSGIDAMVLAGEPALAERTTVGVGRLPAVFVPRGRAQLRSMGRSRIAGAKRCVHQSRRPAGYKSMLRMNTGSPGCGRVNAGGSACGHQRSP